MTAPVIPDTPADGTVKQDRRVAATQVDREVLTGVLAPVRARPLPRLVSERWQGPVLLLPAFLFLAAFTLLPAVAVFVLSGMEFNFLTDTARWIGTENLERILPSDELARAVRNTVVYVVLTVPTAIALGLIVALAMQAVRHARGFWRAVYFLPVVSTLVASAVAWRWLFFPDTGVIDRTIGEVFGVRGWLTDLSLALPAVAIVGVWSMVGYNAVLFLAGLTGVPEPTKEAARLDGAGRWSLFWHVTWPALGPTTLFVTVINLTFAFQAFETIIVMTGGGPLGRTETLLYVLWRRGIDYLDIGGGSVVSVVLLLLLTVVTLLQLRTFGKRLERGGRR